MSYPAVDPSNGLVRIPYVFDDANADMNEDRRSVMRTAAATWRERTCIDMYETRAQDVKIYLCALHLFHLSSPPM